MFCAYGDESNPVDPLTNQLDMLHAFLLVIILEYVRFKRLEIPQTRTIYFVIRFQEQLLSHFGALHQNFSTQPSYELDFKVHIYF
jgi:hypothetical protein